MTKTSQQDKDIVKLQQAIIDGLEDVKAIDIRVFDTTHLTPLFERVMVASGNSNRQTRAIAASIRDKVREAGFPKPRIGGEENGEWITVDCGYAVAHVMQPEIRRYYNLEEIWGDVPVTGLTLAEKKAAKAEKAAAKKTSAKTAAKKTTAKKAVELSEAVGETASSSSETAAAKKPALKKTAATKTAAKKTASSKAAGKPTASKSAAKPAAKKPAAKTAEAKPVSKLVVGEPVKKPAAAKKTAVKKPAAKKPAAKKATLKTTSQSAE